MNNENIDEHDEDQQLFLFLSKIKDIIPQIEQRHGIIGEEEYAELYKECVRLLIESDRKELQITCVRTLLLIKMKRIDLESVEWERFQIDEYVKRLWVFLKEWSGVYTHVEINDVLWFQTLSAKFEESLAILSLLMNMQATHWSISRWVNSKVDYGMDYEIEDELSTPIDDTPALNLREELQKQLVTITHDEGEVEHPTFYFTNVAFHTWQMAMIQDMFRSMAIIRSFVTSTSTIIQSPECVSFVEGIHYYVKLCLQNANHHKECMSFLMDRWLSEMTLPGLRGTSMTSTNIVNKSVWKQILPDETAKLLTRLKDARLDAIWMSLKDDVPYDTCIRHAIFKQIMELTFSLYIRSRFLKVELWMERTIADGQIFQHHGWWGVWGSERIFANGWNAPPYVFYRWLCAERSCIFHDAFIRMVTGLRKDTLTLPPPHTEGALIVSAGTLPSYMITPESMKKRKIIN